MAETTDRPEAWIAVRWDPNTGKLDITTNGANKMEQMGMLQFALVELQLVCKPEHQESRIIPVHGSLRQ